jgi:uncharacterized membrane protein
MTLNQRPASPFFWRWAILAACIARLWLMPLASSFWVDEMVTVFVVRYPGHPSLAPVPQVPASVYYWLPRFTQHLFGESEVAWRTPSVLAMGLALFLIGRIAARLIHPRADWFAIFACLGLHGINYYAADARPYGLGICVASLSVWLLIRWLDASRWVDGVALIVAASLLWRVQLIYWPFYLVFVIYAVVRLARKETKAGFWQTAGLFGLIAISLIPVALNALALFHQASAHVISELPGFREFEHATRWSLVVICTAGTWLVARLLKWRTARVPLLLGSSLILIVAWWLVQSVALYVFSRVTGDSVFISRYVSLALPGTALAATAAAAMFIPADRWASVSIALGAGVLLVMGGWTRPRRVKRRDWQQLRTCQ